MSDNLFWSLVVKGSKPTAVQRPEIPIRLSNAALARIPSSGEPVKLYMKYNMGEYLLCTLSSKVQNIKIDLVFDDKDDVSFRLSAGEGLVHLCGNVEIYNDLEDDDSFVSVDSAELREQRNKNNKCQGDDSDYEDEMKEAARRLEEMRERREKGNKRSRVDSFRLSHRKD